MNTRTKDGTSVTVDLTRLPPPRLLLTPKAARSLIEIMRTAAAHPEQNISPVEGKETASLQP